MNWQTRPLGDVADLQAGVGFPPDLQGRTEGELPLAKVGDISRAVRAGGRGFVPPLNHITRAEAAGLRARIFPRGSTVFAKIGEAIAQNFRLFTDREAAVDNNVMGAIPRDGVEPRYLFRFLQTVDLYAYSSKTTVPALRKSELEQIPVPVPPLAEQRRIADILDKADAIRRKRGEAIALIQELLRSAFLEMFGDPVTNPKGWPTETVGKLLTLKSGDFLPARQMDTTGPYAVYGGNGINGRHSSYMFEEPVLTIGRVGVYCGAVHRTEAKSWVTDNALYVSAFSPALNATYLEHALRLAHLNQYASQAAQPLISGGRLAPVQLLVPAKALQARFERTVDAHATVLRSAREALAGSHMLFDSLVSRAFSGSLASAC